MNFEIGYGFQNVSKVIAYDLNTLVFLKQSLMASKVRFLYKEWVIYVGYFEP